MPVLLPFRAFTYVADDARLKDLIYVPGEEAPRPVETSLLAQDAEPALYIYRQVFRFPGDALESERTGIMGLLDRSEAGPVYLHEETHADKAIACASALREQLSDPGSLWFWTNDSAGALLPLLNTDPPPDIQTPDRSGTRHEVWRVTDPDSIAAIQDALRGQELFLTDGHHRFSAGWNLATIQVRNAALKTLSCGCTVDEIEAWSRQGILLPPKTTNFWPKLAAGLVMYRHQNESATPAEAQIPGVR